MTYLDPSREMCGFSHSGMVQDVVDGVLNAREKQQLAKKAGVDSGNDRLMGGMFEEGEETFFFLCQTCNENHEATFWTPTPCSPHDP